MKTRSKSVPKRPNSSLASRISAFYTKLFAQWLTVILVIIFILVIGFSVFSQYYGIKPSIDIIEAQTGVAGVVKAIQSNNNSLFSLLNADGEIIALSDRLISENLVVYNIEFVGAQIHDKRVYVSYAKNYFLENQNLKLMIYFDITLILIEMAIIGALAILLFLISVLTIYIQGNYLTKKTFRLLDEFIEKANNISSQNLNLRLNVSNSTDELVELSMTFNRMMDRIEKAYEKQKQFVSDASHELRTPIAVIQGYARMLERWGKDDKEILYESIEAINKESKNMQDLVDKLLFIARNDKDTMVLIKDKFDMSELMEEMVKDTLMLDTKRNIESHIEPGIYVNGDRDRIKQALRIFVDNAIKYTEPGGNISLNLEKDGEYAVAAVIDNGKGISEKDLPNIFDRFYQVESARERDKGGHGLGLAIARIIVLRHGGRIKVSSKVGEGTRFRVYLPID
ncbi:MAG TPA: HAMP domain-containing protein [Clostridiaceae bacterium]|nr:HAMP domain-containing protein [Clostridiaceae bacterium]